MKIDPKAFGDALTVGYTFKPKTTNAIKVINEHFKGFDIKTLVKDLERLLKPYAKEPISREIEVMDVPPTLRIEYKSENYLDEKEGLYVSRTFRFEKDGLVVYHEMQQLPDLSRKQGMGKKIMSAFLEQYEKMEVKRIDLYAALSDGGAVWARFGFKAIKKSEMERILRQAERDLAGKDKILKVVTDTFNSYYEKEPDGNAFPIQNWVAIPGMEAILKKVDSHWHGRMDLTNSKDLDSFKKYVGEKE